MLGQDGPSFVLTGDHIVPWVLDWRFSFKNKIKKLLLQIQNIHWKCVSIHGNSAQITDFTLWVVPKHLPSKPFVLSILYFFSLFLFTDLSLCSIAKFFFFFTKIFSFIERGVSFQTLGCSFVSEFCIALWKAIVMYFWHNVTCLLIDTQKFCGKCGFSSVPFEVHSLFLLQRSVF